MPLKLVVPAPAIVSAVLEAIVPVLKALESEFGFRLRSAVTVWAGEARGEQVIVSSRSVEDPGSSGTLGEMRLSFRETAVEGRLLFFGECVFPRDLVPPGTQFSGFDLHGVVRVTERVVVLPESWTVKHRVWRFKGWL